MRKVIVNEFLALDGTAQSPGGADEDASGGFQHGGWHMPYGGGDGMAKLVGEAGGFLLGRHTYEIFAGYWPIGDLLVIGSTALVRSLILHGLVDEFRLLIDPVLVGGGKRIFPDDGALRPLRLVDHEATRAGVIIATYAPASWEPVQNASTCSSPTNCDSSSSSNGTTSSTRSRWASAPMISSPTWISCA
jgi:dihydrofolate reductase